MALSAGVFAAVKKNGQVYYRASITYRNKHISLGSFDTEEKAHAAYLDAGELIASSRYQVEDYVPDQVTLPFEKWVSLVNFRDNDLYIKTPIYLKKAISSIIIAPTCV